MVQVVLESISEDELLRERICDLPLQIAGTWLEKAIAGLYQELEGKGIALRPECYLADEWFSPNDKPLIGIPFYLAHPRLIALEEKMMLEAEGSTLEWCMRLLRHEAGHAVSHAYRMQKMSPWVATFGDPKKPYAPETVRPRLYSRNFVTNLEKGYAQAHPDEDWAESFAVWLDPSSSYATHYRGWPAMKKIHAVDALMRRMAKRSLPRSKNGKIMEAGKLRTRLGTHYAKKRRFYREEFPEFFDSDLEKMFRRPDAGASGETAARFLHKHRRRLTGTIAMWSRARRYTVDGLLQKLIKRCDALKVHLYRTEAETLLDVSAYLTTLALNYFFTGKLKRT